MNKKEYQYKYKAYWDDGEITEGIMGSNIDADKDIDAFYVQVGTMFESMKDKLLVNIEIWKL